MTLPHVGSDATLTLFGGDSGAFGLSCLVASSVEESRTDRVGSGALIVQHDVKE